MQVEADACGFVLLDKVAGITSFAALYPVKKMFRPLRAGHAGTLDQAASGLLVVAVGKATRLLPHLERANKVYTFTLHLGSETDTLEKCGQVLVRDLNAARDCNTLEQALGVFTGALEQVPPVYSALKIEGKRASDRARKGEVVELRPRPIEIFDLRLLETPPGLVTEFQLYCHCSKGTYIRSLGRDLAKTMQTVGSVSNIRRLAVGALSVDNAWQANSDKPPQLHSPLQVFPHFPRVIIQDLPAIKRFSQGNAVLSPLSVAPVEPVFVLNQQNELLGVAHCREQRLHPVFQLR